MNIKLFHYRKPILSEAEIQVLIGMIELDSPITTPNNSDYTFYPQTEAEAKQYFGRFAVDWPQAYQNLIKRGYLEQTASGVHLSSEGVGVASILRQERPPLWYAYQAYYMDANRSEAHASFCKRVFGANLCQDGFADLQQLHELIDLLQINQTSRVLDLGCGNGMITEYVADQTGAFVYGIDYIPEAIRQAQERTRTKKGRLAFAVGNMDSLNFPAHHFDAAIAIDTLYMPNHLEKTIAQISQIIKRPGQIGTFYTRFLDGGNRESGANDTDLARVFTRAGIPYQVYDFSKENYELMRRKNKAAKEFKDLYLQEGNESLYQKVLRESLDADSVYDEKTCNMRRYLYHAMLI